MSYSEDSSLVHFETDENEFEDVEFLEPESEIKLNEQNFEGERWNVKAEIPEYLNITEENGYDVDSVKRYFTILLFKYIYITVFFCSEDFNKQLKVEEVFIKSEGDDDYYAEKPV